MFYPELLSSHNARVWRGCVPSLSPAERAQFPDIMAINWIEADNKVKGYMKILKSNYENRIGQALSEQQRQQAQQMAVTAQAFEDIASKIAVSQTASVATPQETSMSSTMVVLLVVGASAVVGVVGYGVYRMTRRR